MDTTAIAQVFFARGPYFVFVVGAGVSEAGSKAARSLATALAATQYRLLPG